MKINMENPFVVIGSAAPLAIATMYFVKAVGTAPTSGQVWMPLFVAGFLTIIALTMQLYLLSYKLNKQRAAK